MSPEELAKKNLLGPWDVFIVLLLTVLSFLSVMIFGLQQNTATAEKEVVLRVNGTEIKAFPLMAEEKSYTYTHEDKHGDYNLIGIDGDRVRIKEVDCDDQICVHRGWAIRDGETTVYLPRKLVIEV